MLLITFSKQTKKESLTLSPICQAAELNDKEVNWILEKLEPNDKYLSLLST